MMQGEEWKSIKLYFPRKKKNVFEGIIDHSFDIAFFKLTWRVFFFILHVSQREDFKGERFPSNLKKAETLNSEFLQGRFIYNEGIGYDRKRGNIYIIGPIKN